MILETIIGALVPVGIDGIKSLIGMFTGGVKPLNVADKNTQPVELVAGGLHEIEAIEDGTVFVNIFTEKKY